MCQAVPDQVSPLAEAAPAVTAGMGPLASVGLSVPGQRGAESEGFAALRAGVRAPRAMGAQVVLGKVGTLPEALPALGAGKGTLARVHPLVYQQPRAAGKGFAALGAGEGALARVPSPVHCQRRPVAEAAATLGTGEGALSSVQRLVPHQRGTRPEPLPTCPTPKGTGTHCHGLTVVPARLGGILLGLVLWG